MPSPAYVLKGRNSHVKAITAPKGEQRTLSEALECPLFCAQPTAGADVLRT